MTNKISALKRGKDPYADADQSMALLQGVTDKQFELTIGDEATNARALTLQMLDKDGVKKTGVQNVMFALFANAAGTAFATTGGSTGIAITGSPDQGALLAIVAKKLFLATTDQEGELKLTWTDTGTEAVYLGVLNGDGTIQMSAVIQNA